MTNTNIITVPTLQEYIHMQALRATNTALKTIYSNTGNQQIQELRQSLQRDIAILRGQAPIGQTVSEAYDLYQTAYTYLFGQIANNGNNIHTVIGRKQYKGVLKEVTVFTAACKEVNKYINAQKSKYSADAQRITYMEDMQHNDDRETTDTALIKATRYYDVHNYEDWQDLRQFKEAICKGLNPYQKAILHYRLQGLPITKQAIVDPKTGAIKGYAGNCVCRHLGVSQQAVSKQLAIIQQVTIKIAPEKVAAFKMQRNSAK